MDSYSRMKAELALLCERGKVSKNLKKVLSRYDSVAPSERVYSVCSDFYAYASDCAPETYELARAGELLTAFVTDEKQRAPEYLFKHYDTVIAYIKLIVKANSVATSDALDKVSAFYESFCESLECVRRGLPLF